MRLRPLDEAVGIGQQEALLVGGEAVDGGAGEPGDREHALDGHPPVVGLEHELAALAPGHLAGDELHAGGGELVAHGGGGGRPEPRERLALGRHDHDAQVVQADAGRLAGGHQRQLVGGQRPDGAGRDDDGQRLRVALVDVGEQAAEHVGVAARLPGDRTGHAIDRDRAHRHQQRVEAQGLAAGQPHLARCVVDADQRVVHEPGAGLGGEGLQRDLEGVAHGEGLGHRERPVDEMRMRRDERQGDPVVGQRAKRQEALQPSDAAAGDDDVHGHSLARSRPGREPLTIL